MFLHGISLENWYGDIRTSRRCALCDWLTSVALQWSMWRAMTIYNLLFFYHSTILHYSRTDSPVECTVGHIPESLSPFRATNTCSICPSSARMTPCYNCVAIIILKNRSHALQSQVIRIMWQRIIAWQLWYCTRCIISCCLRYWTGSKNE